MWLLLSVVVPTLKRLATRTILKHRGILQKPRRGMGREGTSTLCMAKEIRKHRGWSGPRAHSLWKGEAVTLGNTAKVSRLRSENTRGKRAQWQSTEIPCSRLQSIKGEVEPE